jgi:nuclease HARBI1
MNFTITSLSELKLIYVVFMQIEDKLEYVSNRNDSITPINQLLIALRFYATGTFQLVVGDTFAVCKATVCRIVHKVTEAIAGLRIKYVKFPTTPQERQDTMNLFYSASKMPGVVGAIDCTHVPIQSPGGNDAEIFRNRKGYFSVNVQLVCDNTGYISDVVARWPGSVHDSTIFDNCQLRAHLETGAAHGYLVGDGGYACRRYLLTPLTNPTTLAEKAYNAAQISARNCIERTNGRLKRRFPAVKYGMRLRIDHILPVIVATVVLHNIAVVLGDEDPPDDQQLDQFLIAVRDKGLQVHYDPVEVGPPTVNTTSASSAMRKAVIDSHFTNRR